MAAEIITAEDFEQKIVSRDQLVKTADNFILLLDTSQSMELPFRGSNKSKYEVLKAELKKRNTYLPDLGYKAGIYLHTPWKEVLPMQPYSQQRFASALETLPEKPSGLTDIQKGLELVEPVLADLSGHTVVFLFSDGYYNPWLEKQAITLVKKEISEEHNVCFYIISLAQTDKAKAFLAELAAVNECSRVIPFDSYIDRPEFNSGALFTVKSTEKIVTIADRKVVGLKTNPILFDFNMDEIGPEYFQELDAIGKFMKDHPKVYAVIHGYTDSIGSQEYNLGLSRRRAEAIKNYLTSNHRIASNRLLTDYYGRINPVSNNSTSEGRSNNRRVEIAIGGLE